MTRPTTGTAETQGGACRMRFVADRVPSLRAWSTHEVYRAAFTVPVDPPRLATIRSRYALVQLTAPGAMPEAIGLGVGRRTASTEALA